jgi:hypothetical protein
MKQQNQQWALWALSCGKWSVSCLSHLCCAPTNGSTAEPNPLPITLEYIIYNVRLKRKRKRKRKKST